MPNPVEVIVKGWQSEPALADTMRFITESGDADWLVHQALASLRTLPVEERMEAMGMVPCSRLDDFENVETWMEGR